MATVAALFAVARPPFRLPLLCWPCALTRRRFRVFLVRLLSGSARVSPSGFGEYRPRRLTQLTRQCRCAPSKSLSSNQQEKERSTPHFVCGPTGIRNCSTRASTVFHARALSCWPPYSPGCHACLPTRLTSDGRSRLDVYRGIQPTEVPGWHPGANSTSGNTSMNAL